MGNTISSDMKYVDLTGFVSIEGFDMCKTARNTGKTRDFQVPLKKVSIGNFLDMNRNDNILRAEIDELMQFKILLKLSSGTEAKELQMKTYHGVDVSPADIPLPVQGLFPTHRLKHMFDEGILSDESVLKFHPDPSGKVFRGTSATIDNRLHHVPGDENSVFDVMSYIIDEKQRVHLIMYCRQQIVNTDLLSSPPPVVSKKDGLHTNGSQSISSKAFSSSQSDQNSTARSPMIGTKSIPVIKNTSTKSHEDRVEFSKPHKVLFYILFLESFLVLALFRLYWEARNTISDQNLRLSAYGNGAMEVCKYLFNDPTQDSTSFA